MFFVLNMAGWKGGTGREPWRPHATRDWASPAQAEVLKSGRREYEAPEDAQWGLCMTW